MDQHSLWLKTHSQSERSFQRALKKYFQQQASRVADAISDFDVITTSSVPLIFNEEYEADLLKSITHRNLAHLMAIGAIDELAVTQPVKSQSKGAFDDFVNDMPESTIARIQQALDELEQQPYWRNIQTETTAKLTRIINQGINEGESNYEIGIRIREQLGGFPANKRAQKIARTETTGALNTGHEAAREELYAEGLVIGKRWLIIKDDDARIDHEVLHNVVAGPRDDFNVGGTEAPYPGHWGLPAEQRIHCRCTTVGVMG